MRLIDADALKKHIDEVFCKPCSHKGAMCDACYMDDALYQIECAPSVDAAPVRHGRWAHHKGGYSDHYECTVCGEGIVLTARFRYCPNCGAKMDGGDDNEVD